MFRFASTAVRIALIAAWVWAGRLGFAQDLLARWVWKDVALARVLDPIFELRPGLEVPGATGLQDKLSFEKLSADGAGVSLSGLKYELEAKRWVLSVGILGDLVCKNVRLTWSPGIWIVPWSSRMTLTRVQGGWGWESPGLLLEWGKAWSGLTQPEILKKALTLKAECEGGRAVVESLEAALRTGLSSQGVRMLQALPKTIPDGALSELPMTSVLSRVPVGMQIDMKSDVLGLELAILKKNRPQPSDQALAQAKAWSSGLKDRSWLWIHPNNAREFLRPLFLSSFEDWTFPAYFQRGDLAPYFPELRGGDLGNYSEKIQLQIRLGPNAFSESSGIEAFLSDKLTKVFRGEVPVCWSLASVSSGKRWLYPAGIEFLVSARRAAAWETRLQFKPLLAFKQHLQEEACGSKATDVVGAWAPEMLLSVDWWRHDPGAQLLMSKLGLPDARAIKMFGNAKDGRVWPEFTNETFYPAEMLGLPLTKN